MARRRHVEEDHVNHEAWAIPYGDLVTLLLAFFVVMYAISSVNEGKYRVMADALSSAFGGTPQTINPIQLGETQLRGSSYDRPSLQTAGSRAGPAAATPVNTPRAVQVVSLPDLQRIRDQDVATTQSMEASEGESVGTAQLRSIGKRIQEALSELVDKNLVTVRRGENFIEVEIQSDILFPSGVATPSPMAISTVQQLARVLKDEANAMRVEGYTDNQPINTLRFPSNWELSTARAGSVVHELVDAGVSPQRLGVIGYGQYQPVADNSTPEGRNANRRVLLVILAKPQGPDAVTQPLPAVVAKTVDGASPTLHAPASTNHAGVVETSAQAATSTATPSTLTPIPVPVASASSMNGPATTSRGAP